MTSAQISRIFLDINNIDVTFNKWFQPKGFDYIVLKDNSLLYIGYNDMWYFDSTDELLYVASAPRSLLTGELQMPSTGVVNTNNIQRLSSIIDFENINHVSLNYQGQYMGGRRK